MIRRLQGAAMAVVLVLGAVGCGGGQEQASGARRSGEDPGTWKPWVLTSASQIKVPAPGPPGPELKELKDLAGRRTVEIRQQIDEWNVEPLLRPWIELSLELVAARPKDPVNASRAYGYTGVAMYDAMVAVWHWKYVYNRQPPEGVEAAVSPGGDPSYPSEHAAIAGAASRMLAYLFPERPAVLYDTIAEEAAESRVFAGVNYRSDVVAGLALGRAVADAVIARAKADGSDRTWDGNRPRGRGLWEPPPGSTAQPVQPLAGSWRPWVMSSGDQFRAPPPPEFGSEKFVEEARELIRIKNSLTEEQKRIATFWAGGEGTSLPPGVWNEVMLAYVHDQKLDTPHTARVLALLNVAMSDAGIAAWDTKYAYWNPRPENAIPELGLDPDWKPYIPTPFFPAYVSGHSTYSSAAGEVMAFLFPTDAKLFREKAEEAGISRMYGGIHYSSDNVEGLKMGRQIGALVVERAKQDGAGT